MFHNFLSAVLTDHKLPQFQILGNHSSDH